MSKITLKIELEELYFKALAAEMLNENGMVELLFYNDSVIDRIMDLEELVYGIHLNPGYQTTSKVPWKKAYKRYLELKNSELYKLLEENNE